MPCGHVDTAFDVDVVHFSALIDMLEPKKISSEIIVDHSNHSWLHIDNWCSIYCIKITQANH